MIQHAVILNVVGLTPRHLEQADRVPNLAALARRGRVRRMRPSFPAVTCSVQATLLTGQPPSRHGIVGNGYFDRATFEVKFWDQPASLVQAPRFWAPLAGRQPGFTTAVLFWQNSMYLDADIVVTPRPIHLDSGMVQWCYSKPAGYYEDLSRQLGPFKLQSYWGPLAGLASSRWIARAAQLTWRKHRPNLMLVYLPHLDYSSQKYGPDAPPTRQALREIDDLAGELLGSFGRDAAAIVCSEYALSPVRGAIFPNRLLRAAGLLRVREIAGIEYLDFELSDAFAVVDHQVAHVYCQPTATDAARAALDKGWPGLGFASLNHPRAGDLVAVAPADKWFAYAWWTDPAKAPEFAHGVDIHRKPGYDPCELWFDWRRMARTFRPATATDAELVRGSHGRVPRDGDDGPWATLLLDETAAESAGASLPDPFDATGLAPLVRRLFTGTDG